MFNECHIHSCNCTCLNVFSHALSLLIYHKKIFECFSCFWKVLCFYKNCQNFQKLFCPILATQSRVELVACPSRESITEIFCDSLATHWRVNASVMKKDLEYFSKFWNFVLFAAQVGDLFAGGRSSREGYTKIFTTQFVTLSRVELLVAKNT